MGDRPRSTSRDLERYAGLFARRTQGMGLAGAAGVRPFLPALLSGALGRADLGLDFDHTRYAFLESNWFLIAVVVLLILTVVIERRSPGAAESGTFGAALGGVAVGIGTLLFAGSLADTGHESWPGILGGIACAVLGYYALAALFSRARRRLAGSGGAVTLLGLYADGIALALAGLSILFPPIAYAALVVFVVLIARARTESAQKYEGLRSLR